MSWNKAKLKKYLKSESTTKLQKELLALNELITKFDKPQSMDYTLINAIKEELASG